MKYSTNSIEQSYLLLELFGNSDPKWDEIYLGIAILQQYPNLIDVMKSILTLQNTTYLLLNNP